MRCHYCDGAGHIESCEALEPAWDIGDLIARTPCTGCCPVGCQPRGMQAAQDAAAVKAQRMVGRAVVRRDAPPSISDSGTVAIPDPDHDARQRGRGVLTTGGKGTGQVRRVTASRRR